MGFRRRLERGHALRVEDAAHGVLLLAAFALHDLRPAYVACALIALQGLVSPIAGPFALLYALVDRREPTAGRGDIYCDTRMVRGASVIACMGMIVAFVLLHFEVPVIGYLMLGAACASSLLAATVGFCGGRAVFVLGRDLLVHRAPEGATDVQYDNVDQQQMSAPS